MDPSARFAQEQRALLVERSRWLLGFGILFFPSFIPLDFIVAPHVASQVLIVRLAVVGLLALFFGATWTTLGRRLIRAVSVGFALVAALAIVLCTWLDAGFESNYVVGVMLVMVGGCFFLPWRLGPAAIFCAVSCLGYLALNLWGHGWSDTGLAWVLFLFGSAAVACLATHLNARSRLRSFNQRIQLERAKLDLEELGEARSRFFANVSHELRTPLMLILGPLEDLLEDEEDPDRARTFGAMWKSGARLQRQVEMLLDMARLEAGRLEARPQAADLGALLEGLVAAAGPHAEREGIDLVTVGLLEPPSSLFDPDLVETVAGNLLSNALKFTPRGGRIVVEAGTVGEGIWFEVRDTGPGIPMDQLERIFDRFHRVENSGVGGTGLGLALTKEMVELNGGRITARSSEEGAALRVVLPLRPPSVDVVEAGQGVATSVEVGAGAGRLETLLSDAGGRAIDDLEDVVVHNDAPHLLLVEDNADLRAFVTRQLSRRYRVSTAQDGLDGLQQIEALSPDLVLSDVMMPRMDGLEMCRRVRANPAHQALPLILLTARGELEDLVGGLHLGADDYVTKPFHLSELEARIEALLRLRRAEKRAAEREGRLAAIEAVAEEGGTDPGVLKAIRQLAQLRGIGTGTARQPVEVTNWVKRVLEPLHDELWGRGVEVHLVDHSGGAAIARMDPEQMRSVVQSLVRNAGEAAAAAGTKDGIRHIFLTVEAATDVRIRVADDGPGTPLELAQRLFTPRRERSELVELREAVRKQGGRLGLEVQAPEGGAAFTIRLPTALRPSAD